MSLFIHKTFNSRRKYSYEILLHNLIIIKIAQRILSAELTYLRWSFLYVGCEYVDDIEPAVVKKEII